MTKVVIVSRTRMGEFSVCIGGLTRDTHRDVRLLGPDGSPRNPGTSPYQIGDVWELELSPAAQIEPPHVEDVVVGSARRIAHQYGLEQYLSDNTLAWAGGPEALFDGTLEFRNSGAGYLPPTVAETRSVGFWRPDAELTFDAITGKYRYERSGQSTSIRYVGEQDATQAIPAGALVRVSLSRPFEPPGGPRACWLQLSGWYPPQ